MLPEGIPAADHPGLVCSFVPPGRRAPVINPDKPDPHHAGAIEPHLLPIADLRERLRRCLTLGDCASDAEPRILPFSPGASPRLRHLLPPNPTPAAVLIPLVDHADEMTVLLTHRATDLKHHPGQISFPGGRLEATDANAIAAALRETEEEIGLPSSQIEILGRLPDHVVITGYRVTPIVALIRPGFALRLDPMEVSATFEAPLRHLLDPATHARRVRQLAGEEYITLDLPWQGFNIWGATAGMLLTLREFLGGHPLHGD